jgi:hypothetical protein
LVKLQLNVPPRVRELLPVRLERTGAGVEGADGSVYAYCPDQELIVLEGPDPVVPKEETDLTAK